MGIDVVNKAGFRPNLSHIHPIINDPTTPPIAISEPIQAISDNVIGPFSNGDWSDSNIKNADDVQPAAVP